MGLRYAIDVGEHLVTVTVSDRVSYEEWEVMIQAVLADPAYQPGFDFLSDRRTANPPPTIDAIRRGMAFFEIHREKLSNCRWALVVAGAAAYGMGRMTEALAAETGVRVKVFTEMDDARRWLLPQPAEQD